jgi:hypothetical protein
LISQLCWPISPEFGSDLKIIYFAENETYLV